VLYRTYFSPTKWGDWTFDREQLTLTHVRTAHEVDLEELTTSAAAFEALARARHKAYMPRKALGSLAEALIDLLGTNPAAGAPRPERTPEQLRAGALEQELRVRAQRELRRREDSGPVPWRTTSPTGLPFVNLAQWGDALDTQVEEFRRLRDGA
jgi:hypothetical protein